MAFRDVVWTGGTTTKDPALFGPGMHARTDQFANVVIRLELRREDGQPFQDSAQIFWCPTRLPESEPTSERFTVTGDGQWHEYQIPGSQNPRWRGILTRLRLDPTNQSGVAVEVDSIRLK